MTIMHEKTKKKTKIKSPTHLNRSQKTHTNKDSQTIQKPRQPEPHNTKNKIRESEGSQRKNMTGNATKNR
jgi:hypothetical protein